MEDDSDEVKWVKPGPPALRKRRWTDLSLNLDDIGSLRDVLHRYAVDPANRYPTWADDEPTGVRIEVGQAQFGRVDKLRQFSDKELQRVFLTTRMPVTFSSLGIMPKGVVELAADRTGLGLDKLFDEIDLVLQRRKRLMTSGRRLALGFVLVAIGLTVAGIAFFSAGSAYTWLGVPIEAVGLYWISPYSAKRTFEALTQSEQRARSHSRKWQKVSAAIALVALCATVVIALTR